MPDASESGSSSAELVAHGPAAPANGPLPVEQAAPAVSSDSSHKAALKALLSFHLHGIRPAGSAAVAKDLWPALVHPYREFEAIRYEFPLCLPTAGQAGTPQPLSQLMDQFIEMSREEGDARERLRRHMYQLELEIKRLSEAQPKAGLDQLLVQAASHVLQSSRLQGDKRAQLEADLELAGRNLPGQLSLVACGPNAPRRLFTAIYEQHWHAHCAGWRDELATLIAGLGNILKADFDRSPAARSAKHLKNTLGTGDRNDVDAGRLANILDQVHLSEPLPESRRERIQKTLDVLKRLQPVFGGLPSAPVSKSELPFPLAPVADDCAAAMTRRRLQSGVLLEFFKSVRVAQLELDNRYQESVHDPFFARFDESHLSEEERGLCPPVVLQVRQSKLSSHCAGQLIDILMSGWPFKIVMQVDDLTGDPDEFQVRWPARIADLARSLPGVFVMQSPVSALAKVQSGFQAGLRYPGPALFSVYTGIADGGSKLPPYLDSAAANEARLFPAYQCDPSEGSTLAQTMRLLDNPQPQRAWVQESLAVEDPDGERQERDLLFTPADFLLGDSRVAEHFWAVEPAGWHDNMLPLREFLQLQVSDRQNKVPYILAIDGNGGIARVVMTRSVLQVLAESQVRWRKLQEEAGIENSHAQALLAAEQQRMESQLQADIARIQDAHDERLGQSLGELTREIVARIASQLASGATAPQAAAVAVQSRSSQPAPQAAAQAADTELLAEPEQEADEDENLSLDDPYIDTPLCTACDDCTKMSPMVFAYNENKQAYIKDASAGSYKELVLAAEKCPVKIIHPGKPLNPNEDKLDEWIKRAEPFR